jgi:hypothetical protein
LDIRGFPVLLLRIADDFDAMISLWMEWSFDWISGIFWQGFEYLQRFSSGKWDWSCVITFYRFSSVVIHPTKICSSEPPWGIGGVNPSTKVAKWSERIIPVCMDDTQQIFSINDCHQLTFRWIESFRERHFWKYHHSVAGLGMILRVNT